MRSGSGADQEQTSARAGNDRNGGSSASRASRGTVLVASGDDVGRPAARQLLLEAGYRVFEAIDAASALALVEREAAVDLVLLDVGKPVADGRDFAAAYWGMKLGWPHPPLLALTAEKGVVAARGGDGLNAVGFLTTPFEVEELMAAVERCVRR